MQGCLTVPFSALFADTVRCHGMYWAYFYYRKHGMADWEFQFWATKVRHNAEGYA